MPLFNEIIFVLESMVVIAFSLLALRMGVGALVSWVTVQALIANLFVLKQITLFSLTVTASDVFAIGGLLGLNFLQEYYGKEEARKAAWVAFFFMMFFAVVSQLHLLYQPSATDTTQAAFTTVLAPAPRLLIASLSVFAVVQLVDMFVFGWLKQHWPSAGFYLRAAVTLTVSQFLDTVLFSFIGLYGLVSSVWDVIAISFLVKVCVILGFSSITKWVRSAHV